MTSRRVITLLLFVALVPMALYGMANWREAAKSDSALSVRSQPGRAHARSFGVRLTGSEEIEPGSVESELFHRVSRARADGRPLRPHTAELGAAPVAEPLRDQAMMIVPKSDAVDPPRRSRGTAAFGGGSSGDAAAPSSGVSDAVVEPSALVELVGVTQTGTVLNQEQFLADVLRELKIIVWWNLTGTNSQRLEFFTPNGVLYKQFTSEFDADATRSPSSGLAPVEIRLPVGGTWITQYSLLGSWRVDVYLVGQRTRITSASFLLYR